MVILQNDALMPSPSALFASVRRVRRLPRSAAVVGAILALALPLSLLLLPLEEVFTLMLFRLAARQLLMPSALDR